MKRRAILLTASEIQSGYDRQKWAEGLISQLPSDHEGRNTWLMHYGVGAEAVEFRKAHDLGFGLGTMAAFERQDRAAERDARQRPSDEEILKWAGEEQFFLFCDRDELLQIARAVLERFGMADAYSGAAEDKGIWKKRALEAEAALRQEKETSARLCNALNHECGPKNMGEPILPGEGGGEEWK